MVGDTERLLSELTGAGGKTRQGVIQVEEGLAGRSLALV